MGLKVANDSHSNSYPVLGRKNSYSSSSLLANRLSGSKKLSQSTLQKIFIAMLAVVFVLYAVLMMCLVLHKDFTDVDQGEGKWGPPILATKEMLKEHIQDLAQKRRNDLQERAQQIRSSTARDKRAIKGFEKQLPPGKPRDVTIGAGAYIRGASKDLEELDIHEMKHPDEIRKAKQQQMLAKETKLDQRTMAAQNNTPETNVSKQRVLKAYLEPIHLEDWERKPLPRRTTTADQLTVIEYPRVTSCERLPELWPIDDYPDADPFLPWIHDVFPTDDGRFIQFVAQNKRRCRTGTTPDEIDILEKMQPQIALFQHVPIKRSTNSENQTSYQLTSHEEADQDGLETRFICKFSPSGEETLSIFNVQYDYAAKRKKQRHTFSKEGHKDIKSIHTSQLVFQCPVPKDLVETVREGKSVVNDQATMFVTLVPIRTPPRYGAPDQFLPPYYRDPQKENTFKVAEEWGNTHILPRIEDSGRWENIPICLPTWKAYPSATAPPPLEETKAVTPKSVLSPPSKHKKHRLIASTWASTGYSTRGDRFAISDGSRRLDEWIRFHLMVGVDHVFIYDNSQGGSSLKPVTDQFPDQVTRVPWPATICNNNRNFADSPGERSSQYAAESSWRLRFGPHADWIASMDIDEYIVPVGNYTSLKSFLNEMDKNGKKIVSFGSWRAWPRRDLIEEPVPIVDKTICDDKYPCFSLNIPPDRSVLQTYNCDRQKVKNEHMPAEKQIYRPDYVLQHFVHYSTITRLGEMNEEDTVTAGFRFGRVSPDPLSRFADEITEITMLHTKAIATQDTAGWQTRCKGETSGNCRIGNPFPDIPSNLTKDDEGWLYNCYVNQKIEKHWVPRLNLELKKSALRIMQS